MDGGERGERERGFTPARPGCRHMGAALLRGSMSHPFHLWYPRNSSLLIYLVSRHVVGNTYYIVYGS